MQMLFLLFVGGFWDFFVIVGTGLIFILYESESNVASDFTVLYTGWVVEVPLKYLFYFILFFINKKMLFNIFIVKTYYIILFKKFIIRRKKLTETIKYIKGNDKYRKTKYKNNSRNIYTLQIIYVYIPNK